MLQKPVFRFVESEGQIQSNTYQCYAVPQDIVHLTTGEDPIKLIDFLKLVYSRFHLISEIRSCMYLKKSKLV